MSFKWNYSYITWSNWKLRSIIQFFSPLLVLTVSSTVFANNAELLNKIQLLESRYNETSTAFYLDKVNYTNSKLILNIDELLSTVNSLSNEKKSIKAIQLIYRNINTVRENLDHQAIFSVIELLLDHNEIKLANNLFQRVKNEGDDFQLNSIQLIFAKYHAARFEWPQVVKLLKNTSAELSAENAAYASLLMGTALQYLKLHRRAEESYKKIPIDSAYYRHAQLNSAIAQIRQGWLTNAKNSITRLIQDTKTNNTDEFTNRLYLVLAYALLQKDYYRSAREVFRAISPHSRYTNRALLGIALSAINQKDYESALNTLSILKDKNAVDLSVDESYLLVPYVYEKLHQETNVIASSTDAMNYYQKRISNLLDITKQQVDFSRLTFERTTPIFNIQNHLLEYGNQFPRSFVNNYRQLLSFASINKNSSLTEDIESQISSYNKIFQLIIAELIDQKVSHLNSYLNQVRYGLARLYDNSNKEQQ